MDLQKQLRKVLLNRSNARQGAGVLLGGKKKKKPVKGAKKGKGVLLGGKKKPQNKPAGRGRLPSVGMGVRLGGEVHRNGRKVRSDKGKKAKLTPWMKLVKEVYSEAKKQGASYGDALKMASRIYRGQA